MRTTDELLSSVFSILGHINESVDDDLSILLVKKINEGETTFNVVLRGNTDGETYVLASDLDEVQLKWYVYGLGDGVALDPTKLAKLKKFKSA